MDRLPMWRVAGIHLGGADVRFVERLDERIERILGNRGVGHDERSIGRGGAVLAADSRYNSGSMSTERRLADGRVELVSTHRVEASPLYNRDLAPVPISRRNWSTYNYAALWVSMAHCIPTYMLASGLM